jgi:hypothetical protein
LTQCTEDNPDDRPSAVAALAALVAAEPLESCRRCLESFGVTRRPRRLPCGHHACPSCLDAFDVCAACGAAHGGVADLDGPALDACTRVAATRLAARGRLARAPAPAAAPLSVAAVIAAAEAEGLPDDVVDALEDLLDADPVADPAALTGLLRRMGVPRGVSAAFKDRLVRVRVWGLRVRLVG